MAAEKGRAFLLKVGNGATAQVFNTVAGLLTTGLTINGEPVDITNKDSGGFRELLAGAGTTSWSISATGVFKDSAAENTLRTEATAKTLNEYQIIFESGDKYEGAFQVTSLEYTGEHNGARQYSITLESSGEIVFTAV